MNINYEKKEVSKTQIDLIITITKEALKKEYNKQLEKLSKGVEMKGFRKGNAPKDLAEASVGQKAQQTALEELLPKYATEILQKEEITPAAPLSYDVESVDMENGAKIRATVSIVPPFKLPSFSKIKVKKESTEVTDKDIDELIKHLWTEHRGKAENKDDKWVVELSKKLGFKSKKMIDLKKELSESIKSEKERLVIQKYQSDLLSKAIDLSSIETPEAMIHMEAHAREDSFNNQIKQMNVSAEKYCKIRGVTMDQLRKQWYKDAGESLKNDLFLSKYGSERKIVVSKEELESEVGNIKKQSPDADSKVFDNVEWRSYIERVILKRKAFQSFLEEIDPETFKK